MRFIQVNNSFATPAMQLQTVDGYNVFMYHIYIILYYITIRIGYLSLYLNLFIPCCAQTMRNCLVLNADRLLVTDCMKFDDDCSF